MQRDFGKCGASFMTTPAPGLPLGYCQITCGRYTAEACIEAAVFIVAAAFAVHCTKLACFVVFLPAA